MEENRGRKTGAERPQSSHYSAMKVKEKAARDLAAAQPDLEVYSFSRVLLKM